MGGVASHRHRGTGVKPLRAIEGGNRGGAAPKRYACDVCGREDWWGESWGWYGSDKEYESDGRAAIAIGCSRKCQGAIERASHKNTLRGSTVRARLSRDTQLVSGRTVTGESA